MKKVRIVERTSPSGRVTFVIQQKHFLLRWLWVDGWFNSLDHAQDSFDTLEEAKRNLCHFDGTRSRNVVVFGDKE